MRKELVRTPGEALAYLIDCTLATVSDLASKKSRGKYEFERQIAIAQQGIDWATSMGVDLSTTRGADVLKAGSVKLWAARFQPDPKP